MLEHYVEHHTCREARDILPHRRSRRLLGGAGSRFGRAAIETTERVDARSEQSSGASATPRAAKPSGKNDTSIRVRGEKQANRLGTGQSAGARVPEERRAVEDMGEQRAAHGVVPVLRSLSDLAAARLCFGWRSRQQTACVDAVCFAMAR